MAVLLSLYYYDVAMFLRNVVILENGNKNGEKIFNSKIFPYNFSCQT